MNRTARQAHQLDADLLDAIVLKLVATLPKLRDFQTELAEHWIQAPGTEAERAAREEAWRNYETALAPFTAKAYTRQGNHR